MGRDESYIGCWVSSFPRPWWGIDLSRATVRGDVLPFRLEHNSLGLSSKPSLWADLGVTSDTSVTGAHGERSKSKCK